MFPGFSVRQVIDIREQLMGRFGLSMLQMAEGGGFSIGMVLRYSLGLSSLEAQIAFLVESGFGAMVALAAARQLLNAGASIRILCNRKVCESSVSHAVETIVAMGGECFERDALPEVLGKSHAIVLAGVDVASGRCFLREEEIEVLNESSVPIHCVDMPIGIDLGTGAISGSPVYSASTIAVGTPLEALHVAREVAGRLYVCDISIPRELYKINNTNLGQIFTEQPVQQIFPYLGSKE